MIKEFREFIARGNVIDLGVAVILGASFGALIKSLVDDVLMPILGLFLGGINFGDLYINLSGKSFESYSAAKAAGAAVIGYGAFLSSVITFLLVALAVFFLVKAMNSLYKKKAAEPAAPTRTEELLMEIRDVLARQGK